MPAPQVGQAGLRKHPLRNTWAPQFLGSDRPKLSLSLNMYDRVERGPLLLPLLTWAGSRREDK